MDNNKMVPTVRLNGFTGDWKNTLFNEIVSFFSGLTYSPKDITDGKGTLVLRSSNVQNGEIDLKDSVYVRNEVVNCKNVEIGDIIVVVRNGSRSLIGKHTVIKNKMENTVIGAFMTGIKANNSNFINALLDSQKFSLEVEKNLGATINQITIGSLRKMEFIIPSSSEQIQIGNFFKTVDNQINTQEQKHQKLINLKKAMLEKMFPKEGADVPEIRFNGFTEKWETKMLSEYLDVSKDKNKILDYTKNDVLSVSGEFGIVNQIAFQGRSFAGVSVANYGIVNKGDIVYTKSPLKSNPYGIIKSNQFQTGIVSTLYAVYKCKNNVDDCFVEYYFTKDDRLNKYLKPLVSKGAKNDMKVSDENALKGKVIFPSSYEEQLSISRYFLKLDNLINISNNKIQKFKNIKQALLQKMFV